jgi:hypothetical protein
MEKKKLTQIQARNDAGSISFKPCEETRHNMERIHHLTEELLGMKISKAVMIRRALWLYRLHFLEAFYHAQKLSKNPDELEEITRKFFDLERKNLLNAAAGDMVSGGQLRLVFDNDDEKEGE